MSHYYDIEGNTRYTVPYADPKRKGERPTTLRDAKKHNWVPSVTTIMQVAAKPGLDHWKQNQLLDAAIEIEYNGWSDDPSVFRRKVVSMSKKKGEEASIRGTELHDSLEQFYLGNGFDKNKAFVEPAIELLYETLGDQEWIPEESFAHRSGFGGKVDLCARASINESYVVDFKTKITGDLDKMVAYDEHRMQLAAYSDGLDMRAPRCFNLFISTESPGIVKLVEHTREEMLRAEEMFTCLLEYWQLMNRYTPEL